MSHVDDGTLHAYLDGALDSLGSVEAARVREHLASCERCARRLEQEGAWRDEAAAVLAGAAPEGEDLPPFEEIRARAALAQSPALWRRTRRLAWAASVVLALGTGWMLRGASMRDLTRASSTVTEVMPLSDESREPPTSPARVAAREDPRGEAEGRGEPITTVASEPRQTARGASEGADAGRADAEPAETQVADALLGVPEAKVTDSDVAASSTFADRTVGVAADSTLTGVGGGDSSSVLDEEARAREGRPLTATELPPLGLRSQVARRDAPAPTSAEPGRAARFELAPAEAEEDAVHLASVLAESEPLTVPGLEVLSVSRLEGRGMVGSVRVLQRMEGGDTLELIHLPRGSDPGSLPPVAADGRTELVMPRGAGWLVARARLARQDLEEIVRVLAPVAR